MTQSDTASPGTPSGDPPSGRESALLHGRTDCLQALRQTLLQALDDGSADVWWVDPDFVDWPLDDSDVIDALTRWARPASRRPAPSAARPRTTSTARPSPPT